MKANIGVCFKLIGLAEDDYQEDEFVCHYYQQRGVDVLHICLNNPDQPIINLLNVNFLRDSAGECCNLPYQLIEYDEFSIKVKQAIYMLDIEEFWHEYYNN